MKLLHTADWQLGKPFGRFEADVRGPLTEARFDAIDSIGKFAQERGVIHVLVAGDVFDTDGPDDRTIVQALSRMERHGCRWWLLPGNHDSARNGGIWDRVRAKAGAEVTVLTEPNAVEIEPEVWLLSAPLVHRHNLDDPTASFDTMDTPGAKLRIGRAHGSIRDFGSKGETKNQIAPDRAKLSNLDYLALGDWHGALRVDARTWYSGTPETDSFQRDDPGHALLVELLQGSEPIVTPLRTGRFSWLMREWRVDDYDAFDAECRQLLSSTEPSATLLQLSITGITSLSDRLEMLAKLENDIAHQVRFLDVRSDDLVGRPVESDLASLSSEGMLGLAASKLSVKIEEGGNDAAIARRALEKLFVEFSRGE